MQTNHNRDHIGPESRKFISRGYACESLHSLRFSFVYTAAQRARNKAYADRVGLDSAEWTARIARDARRKNKYMEPVAALLAENFRICQFDRHEKIPYRSDWDLFFWCDDLSTTVRNGLSGRDYSYFTLAFNERHDPKRRRQIFDRVRHVLDTFDDDANLDVDVRYAAVMDDAKIRRDAELAAPGLGGRACVHDGMEGRLEWNGESLFFRKKRSRTHIYKLSDAEILSLSWELLPENGLKNTEE